MLRVVHQPSAARFVSVANHTFIADTSNHAAYAAHGHAGEASNQTLAAEATREGGAL